jgi:hypothetical protein
MEGVIVKEGSLDDVTTDSGDESDVLFDDDSDSDFDDGIDGDEEERDCYID